jgi:hypothetical protein
MEVIPDGQTGLALSAIEEVGVKVVIIAVVIVVALLLVPAAAMAGTLFPASDYGQDFGQHHAFMAQQMGGFSGTMNPGDHNGFSGWDPNVHVP